MTRRHAVRLSVVQVYSNPDGSQMYNVERLQDEAEAFAGAVEQAEPFRPLMVKIKLTWRCNLACEMCDYWRQDLPTPLTTDLVTRTLDELAALGCRKVHFSGGEPTLRPDLPDLIAHARRLKLRVTLTTNGTLLTRDLARRLVKAGLNSVCVSIDSPVRSDPRPHPGHAGRVQADAGRCARVAPRCRAARRVVADSDQHRRQPGEL